MSVNAALIQHSPIIALGTSLYILGGLLNSPLLQPIQSEIAIGTDLPCRDSAPANSTPSLANQTLDASSPVAAVKDPLVVALAAALSLLPICLSGLAHSSAKINALSSLGLGHAATFGTTETMKHFYTKPDDLFYRTCHLPYEVCVELKNKLMLVRSQQPEPPDDGSPTCVLPDFNAHLHTVPNISLGLLAASATAFLFNIHKFKQLSAQPIRAQTLKIKLALLFSFVALLFCLISALFETNRNNVADHILSVAYGAILQYFICFVLDKSPSADQTNVNL